MTEQVRSEPARRRRVELVAGQVPADRRWAPGADAGDEGAHDDTLTVLFLCCHPVLTPASAIALTLRSVGGLTTGEIARISDNPLITLNRAVALAMVEGPDAGPVLLADPAPALDGRHRLYAVRAHLHELAGRRDAAVARLPCRRTPHAARRASRNATTSLSGPPVSRRGPTKPTPRRGPHLSKLKGISGPTERAATPERRCVREVNRRVARAPAATPLPATGRSHAGMLGPRRRFLECGESETCHGPARSAHQRRTGRFLRPRGKESL
jgi:hypothetical protein